MAVSPRLQFNGQLVRKLLEKVKRSVVHPGYKEGHFATPRDTAYIGYHWEKRLTLGSKYLLMLLPKVTDLTLVISLALDHTHNTLVVII